METLAKLLGGQTRVKIMRLFLMNSADGFDFAMVRERTKGTSSAVKKDLNHLATLGFLKKKNIMKPVVVKGKAKTKKVAGYVLNADFKYLGQMKELLVGSEFVHKDDLLSRFRKAGKIKFLAVAGVFTNSPESRLDAMIVADKPNTAALDRIMKTLEAEVGKELAYAFFPTKEFIYRAEMYDKLIYDMFDFPHETLLDTEQFSTQLLRKRF
jgi:hypothetical protein